MPVPQVAKASKRQLDWTPPQAIELSADKFEPFVTQPPEGLIWSDQEAYYKTCWMWTGKVEADGQAFVQVFGRPVPVHRFSHLLYKGDVPTGLFARPVACGERLCVCPHHLALVPRGHGRRVLTDRQADDIRWLYFDAGGWSHERLAQTFKVSPTTVGRVLRHRHD